MSLKYTVEHEWVRPEGAVACVGITHHAQDALGDVVFVELPEVGSAFEQGAVAGVVESVKAAADEVLAAANSRRDDGAALHERIQAVEHRLLPDVVRGRRQRQHERSR